MKENGFNVLSISSDGSEVPEIISEEGVAHMAVPMTRSITPIQDLKCLWQLIRLFKKTKPVIVHTHTPKAGLLGMWAASWAGVKVKLHTVAGIPWMESSAGRRLLLKLMEKLTYRFADRVYPNSQGLSEFIMKNALCPPKKLHIIGSGSSNGIDLDHFSTTPDLLLQSQQIKQDLGIKQNAFVYIFIGRVVKDKGINELVSALELIQDDNAHLILVGPFEPDLDPISESTNLQINNSTHIHTPGFQSDVRPWLLAADVLVFPSYREGFPNVPMQAGALGLPVIASDINGCNEIIEDKVNGLLIPPKDTEALHLAMHQLKQDAKLRESLSFKARSMIESRYAQNKIWEELLGEYRELLNREGRKELRKEHEE